MKIKKLVKDDQVIFICILFVFFFLMWHFLFLGEFELPNLKCSKTHTNSNSAEISTSDVASDIEENICVKNNKAVSTNNVSKSIFITEDDLSNDRYFDNFNEEDYLSWVSHSKGEMLLSCAFVFDCTYLVYKVLSNLSLRSVELI